MFDGGLNNEVPLILKHKLPDILKQEYEQCNQANVYLKHTFLTLQKFVLNIYILFFNQNLMFVFPDD